MKVIYVTKHFSSSLQVIVFILLFTPIFLFTASIAFAENLTVITRNINDNGQTRNPSDVGVSVKAGSVNIAGSPAPGAKDPGTLFTVTPGKYTVIVDALGLYTTSYGGDCDSNGAVNVSPGSSKTCIITNNDIPQKLHVITSVINDNGGTAVASSFTIHVRSGSIDVLGSPSPGAVTPGTLFEVNPGTYNVSQDASQGYGQSFGGDCDSGGNVTLNFAEEKTCVVINTYNSGTVPGFPETGGTTPSTLRACLNTITNIFPWIILGLALGYLVCSEIIKRRSRKQ